MWQTERFVTSSSFTDCKWTPLMWRFFNLLTTQSAWRYHHTTIHTPTAPHSWRGAATHQRKLPTHTHIRTLWSNLGTHQDSNPNLPISWWPALPAESQSPLVIFVDALSKTDMTKLKLESEHEVTILDHSDNTTTFQEHRRSVQA